MTYGMFYILIAFILAAAMIIVDSGFDGNERIIHDKKDALAIIVLLAIWPATLLLTIIIGLSEMRKTYYNRKAEAILHKSPQIEHLSIKELRLILKAHELGCIYLSEKEQQNMQTMLTDKSFEQHFLNK